MITEARNDTIVEAGMYPRLIKLTDNLTAASFFLMKLLPAKFILDQAEREGRLRRGSRIAETSSGTFGLALAMLSTLRGYHLTLVSDPSMDETLRLRLLDMGVDLRIVHEPCKEGGFQQARMDILNDILDSDPGVVWPSQYHNPQNAGSYAPVAEILAESLPSVDCIVGTVGSGGSVCGTSHYLRYIFPHLRVIGVDTHRSVLFGQTDGPRLLIGVGNSLLPENCDHTAFDEVHWVSAAEAFKATRELHRQNAMYVGGTSGAAYLVARWYADRHPDEHVTVLFPDEGYRYAASIYDDAWLAKKDLLLDRLPMEPHQVSDPRQVGPHWSRMEWNRRRLDDVLLSNA